jgi:hypothetical protein
MVAEPPPATLDASEEARAEPFPTLPDQSPQIDDHLPHGLVEVLRVLFQSRVHDPTQVLNKLLALATAVGNHQCLGYIQVRWSRGR